RFVSRLENASSGCTLPPHPAVRHIPIQVPNKSDGFAVTFVPASQLVPHRCIVEKEDYLIRAGSNFVPVPHGVLQGMFGRRPTPTLSHAWQNVGGGLTDNAELFIGFARPLTLPYVTASFLIRNDGVIPAEDVYVNLNVILPGAECG